jgi:hypothetical protein
MRKSKISIVKLLIIGFAMLMLGSNDVLAQVSVNLPTITKPQGSASEWVNVTVGDLTGQNVTSFEFTLSYDKSVIFIDSAIVGPVASGGLFAFNADTANQKVKVAFASASALSGSGTLVKLKVHYVNLGASPLAFNGTFKFNAGTPAATITEGSVTIPSIAIGFGSSNANKGDTLLIPVTTTSLTAGNNVLAYNFIANFNAAKIHIIGYSTTSTLSAGGSVALNQDNSAGTVHVAFASLSSLVGSGTLIYLKAVAVDSGISTQSFTSFIFNAGTPGVGTTSGTVTITVVATYKVSGIVAYHNAAVTPIANAVVTLTPASGTALKATTAADGSYSFTGLNAGTFTISAAASLTWGGVNASDALAAVRSFLGLVTLDTVQALAADVNNDAKVNSTDALAIINRYVGSTTSFVKPDWIVWPGSGSITVSSNVTKNFSIIATGDVNESYTVGIAKAGTLNLLTKSVVNVKQSQSFEVPVSISGDRLGALSLKLSYNNAFAKLDGISVSSEVSNLVTNVKDGVITLAWFDRTGGSSPLSLKNGSVLVNLKFTANSSIKDGDNLAISVLPGSEFVDASGIVLENSSIFVPSVKVSSLPGDFVLKQNYPNPFNPSTTIEYSIAQSGNVTVSIYNVTGQEVAKLANGIQEAGYHKIVWNASNLSSGIYFYKLNFNGSNTKFSEIKNMVLLK